MMPPVTIVITRYREPDDLVRRSLAAACGQEGVAGEVLFIDQMEDGTIVETDFPDARLPVRILHRKLDGLSAARNLGIDDARNPLILFLDADAIAVPAWAATMARVLSGEFAIAGSRIRPGWPGKAPIFTRSSVIVDQYSMLDLGTDTKAYPKVVGAAFGVNRPKLPGGLRFSDRFGRRGGKLFGGEESDFCARARDEGLAIAYVGETSVLHLVDAERLTLSWLWRRFYYAGLGRAQQGGLPAPANRRSMADWLFLPLVLPPYAVGWLRGKLIG